MSNSTSRCLALVSVALFAGAPQAAAQEQYPEVGERIASFEMAWVRPDAQTVAERIAAAADVMLQRRIDREAAREGLAAAISGREVGSWMRFEAAPELLIRHIPEVAEIRLLNEELSALSEPRGDIDERRVLELTRRYLQELDARGVLDASMYDLEDAEIGYRRVGAGQVDGVRAYDRIVEYRVSLRPQINGIEVANAGVRFGILPTGELVGLRIGGVSFPFEEGEGFIEPRGEGRVLEREVPTEAIKSRFYRGLPQGVAADIHWERIMYVMPEGEERAIVEPLYVISYSEIREVDGEPIVSRRQTVGYSLTDPDAAPVDFSPVSRQDVEQGQRPERRATQD